MSTDTLQAELWTVGDLFAATDTHYEIPIYQRNYSWGAEQIEQLIDDIWTTAQSEDQSYFLGNLIVAQRKSDQNSPVVTFEVIDGQQRLTTLLLLLRALGVEPTTKLTYQSRRSATEALARLDTSDDEEGAGIHTGFKIIRARLGRLDSWDDRERFTSFLRQSVQLVRAALPDRTDLNKYFEIMNTRGQQLQQVDIVKARLMSYLREDSHDNLDATRGCFSWIWDACADMSSYTQMALTPGNTRLRDQIFGVSWDQLLVRNFAELSSARSQASHVASSGPAWETVGLRAAIVSYARAAEKPVEDDPENRRFESPLRFPSLLLHALKVMTGLPEEDLDETSGRLDDNKLIKLFEDEFRHLGSTEASDRTKRFAEHLLQCKFVLDNFVLKREFTATNGEDGAWSLKRLLRGESMSGRGERLRVNARFPNSFTAGRGESDGPPRDDRTREILLLQSMLRVTYTSPRTMHWITVVLRLHILDQTLGAAAESVRVALRAHARRKVAQAYFAGPEPRGFAIERIVFTYLDYLLASADPDADFTFVYRNSIEHFFPQYADREQSGWDRVGPDDPELNLLGNLALVSIGANSKFSNNLPENKVSFEETIQQSMKLRRMAQLVKVGLWDKHAIDEHHQKMISLLLADLTEAGVLN